MGESIISGLMECPEESIPGRERVRTPGGPSSAESPYIEPPLDFVQVFEQICQDFPENSCRVLMDEESGVSSAGERTSTRSGRSLMSRLMGCFSRPETDSELSLCGGAEDCEFVVENQAVYKVPRYGKITKRSGNEGGRRPRSERLKLADQSAEWRLERERIYQYVRMKTYQNMNPYRMSPNDFLNNISSVFVDNIKNPVPKDPDSRPRVYNRDPWGVWGQAGTWAPAFSYRQAIEDDKPYPKTDEKILVWKIVVVNSSSDVSLK